RTVLTLLLPRGLIICSHSQGSPSHTRWYDYCSLNNFTGCCRSMPVIPIIMSRLMPGKLKDIRIVAVALVAALAIAALADILYFSDLEWRIRTSRTDARLSSLETDAERLLELTE